MEASAQIRPFDSAAQDQAFLGGGQQAPSVDTDRLIIGVAGSLIAALFTVVALATRLGSKVAGAPPDLPPEALLERLAYAKGARG